MQLVGREARQAGRDEKRRQLLPLLYHRCNTAAAFSLSETTAVHRWMDGGRLTTTGQQIDVTYDNPQTP